jgi:hypothetical protein
MLREIVESTEPVLEGEIWDLFKGTAQLVKIMNWGKKEVVKRLKEAEASGQSQEEMIKTFAGVVKEMEKKINDTSLPEDMKKSSIKNFKAGILRGVEKRLK